MSGPSGQTGKSAPGGELFVGALTGTSMDALDAVLFDFSTWPPRPLQALSRPYPKDLRTLAHGLAGGSPDLRPEDACAAGLGALDAGLGHAFGELINDLLRHWGGDRTQVTAIGLHGQTLWHAPLGLGGQPPFTVAVADPNRVLERCRLPVVCDFRRRDLAQGGQGAPLAPWLHRQLFAKPGRRIAVLNLGGIANLTWLDGTDRVLGFDTGPGMCLLDHVARERLNQAFDFEGATAARGNLHAGLLDHALADPYFQQPAPKSTGTEYFGATWLRSLQIDAISTPDLLASLSELTARSIAEALGRVTADSGSTEPPTALWVCGGGSRHRHLLSRLSALLPATKVAPTDEAGIPAAWVEALLFAALARARWRGDRVDLRDITGSREAQVLGALYLP